MVETIEKKIRARAPLRLGLAGGGTDLSPYCDLHGGAILNLTIDRYAFASILPNPEGKIVFCADDIKQFETFDLDAALDGAALSIHRGVYERMIRDFNGGRRIAMTVKTTVDAPAGSGLGSSSALVVALVDAFREILNAPLGLYDVAHLAFEIERIDLALAGGRQDQYAATFGGLNFIEFLPNDRVIVNPLRLHRGVRNEFESSLVICFSGRSRKSADIIEKQTTGLVGGSARTIDAMHCLKADAQSMKKSLLGGDLRATATILNKSWVSKQATAQGISNDRIDDFMATAFEAGALGGKISGAGGGGFMFFIVDPEHRYGLIEALNANGGVASTVKFTEVGCETWHFA